MEIYTFMATTYIKRTYGIIVLNITNRKYYSKNVIEDIINNA